MMSLVLIRACATQSVILNEVVVAAEQTKQGQELGFKLQTSSPEKRYHTRYLSAV